MRVALNYTNSVVTIVVVGSEVVVVSPNFLLYFFLNTKSVLLANF